jgi:hypothetical protein
MAQIDNSTFYQKLHIRKAAIAALERPIILEAHGGWGRLYNSLYHQYPGGIVLEKKAAKAQALAQQRPTWAVYECDSVKALAAGLGSHRPVNFLDIDPYGSPWETIQAFMSSDRPFPDRLVVVVNDGLRQQIECGGAWRCAVMEPYVQEFGNRIRDDYLKVCQVMMADIAKARQYKLTGWAGYHCGHQQQITHYWATLERG